MRTNFIQVVPNSHLWTDLHSLKIFLEYGHVQFKTKKQLLTYLLIGLENTRKSGYELRKTK